MAFGGWENTTVRTPTGEFQGIMPVIVSASRATDIPAFYAEWFARRVEAGYLVRTNPFNRRQRQHVSFEKTRVIVFWSKNPEPLERHLDAIDRAGIHSYFTFTLNDYERERLEPEVPPLGRRIGTFRRISERLGPERVVWRFDPILLGGAITPERILEKLERVGSVLHRHTRKLVISFADIRGYRSVSRNLASAGFGDVREPNEEEVRRIAAGIGELNREWSLQLASCAENVDLSRFGIVHNRCIDDELMARLWPDDEALLDFLGRGKEAPPLLPPPDPGRASPLKDKGQRKACGCIVSKDVGRYDTCPHGCVYCYANTSTAAARKAREEHDPGGEEI